MGLRSPFVPEARPGTYCPQRTRINLFFPVLFCLLTCEKYWIGFWFDMRKKKNRDKSYKWGTVTTFVSKQKINFEDIFVRFTEMPLCSLAASTHCSTATEKTFCVSGVCSLLFSSLLLFVAKPKDRTKTKSELVFSLDTSFYIWGWQKKSITVRICSVNLERLLHWLIMLWFIHINLLKWLWCQKWDTQIDCGACEAQCGWWR